MLIKQNRHNSSHCLFFWSYDFLFSPDIGDTSVAARGLAATSANVVVAGFSSHMSVDSSQPCTSIQIRLANGTRLVSIAS